MLWLLAVSFCWWWSLLWNSLSLPTYQVVLLVSWSPSLHRFIVSSSFACNTLTVIGGVMTSLSNEAIRNDKGEVEGADSRFGSFFKGGGGCWMLSTVLTLEESIACGLALFAAGSTELGSNPNEVVSQVYKRYLNVGGVSRYLFASNSGFRLYGPQFAMLRSTTQT